ncbi:MAG: Lrp/AsnC family transcriptional regulator [Candidatus Nanoarchaeia archaeon]|nr:Lrp/AsnC family transcriptional regulator [Candidatus Nanoarchaeia archaeon]
MVEKKDLIVISYLRQNARETLTRLSKKTHIPVSTIYDKIKTNENNLIIKYTSLLDFSKIGFNTRANLMLKVKREKRDELKDYLMKHHNINSLFKVNNGFDFMVDVIFKHIKDMEDFIEILEQRFSIVDKQVHYIVDDIKRESFMDNPNVLEIIN